MMRRCVVLALMLLPHIAAAAVEVETARIGHGVKVWYAENNTVPVVHVTLSFEGAGSVSDPSDKAGRSAIAAAMLTEGAGAYDSVAFQQALEDKAISIDVSSSDDRLTINVHALRDEAVEAGKLLAVALSQPRFDENDLARVKSQTVSLLARLEESPSYQALRKFEETALTGHPYAAPHYGTVQSLAGIGAQDLRNYLATYVARRNVLITAAGDVDAGLLDAMLEPVVEALGTSDAGALPISKVSMNGGGSAVDVPMNVPQSYVLFAAPGLSRNDERFYTYYLLNEILGGNALTSRLGEGVRQKKGLVYSVDTAIDERDGIALLRGSLASRTDRAAEAVEAVKSVMADLRARGATTEECEDARTHVLGSFPLQLDSSTSVAQTLMMMRIYKLGEDYLAERAAKFRAVKCADINTLATELLVPERFLFVTAGSK